MRSQLKQSYLNALIFTIVTFALSLIVLGALIINGTWKDYIVFFLVLETGIFAIILYCIYILKEYDRLYDLKKDPKGYTIPFDSCPDYYTKKFDTQLRKHYCSNEHIVVDRLNPNRPQRIMKIVPDSETAPDAHIPTYNAEKQSPYDKFSSDALYTSTIKDDAARCNVISKKGSAWDGKPYDPTKVMYDSFKEIPWTTVRARCDGLYFAQ